mmetsp:Transcript_26337/g.61568  ORF Transcript_26337/g.61568 Transcript_26337/m.61568 type:complete len:211 (-) Transcript_26337:1100-1732(-)
MWDDGPSRKSIAAIIIGRFITEIFLQGTLVVILILNRLVGNTGGLFDGENQMLDQNLILAEKQRSNDDFVEQEMLLKYPKEVDSHVLDALFQRSSVFPALLLIIFISTLQLMLDVITSLDRLISFQFISKPSQLESHGLRIHVHGIMIGLDEALGRNRFGEIPPRKIGKPYHLEDLRQQSLSVGGIVLDPGNRGLVHNHFVRHLQPVVTQ